jgi:hypothetical protein
MPHLLNSPRRGPLATGHGSHGRDTLPPSPPRVNRQSPQKPVTSDLDPKPENRAP